MTLEECEEVVLIVHLTCGVVCAVIGAILIDSLSQKLLDMLKRRNR